MYKGSTLVFENCVIDCWNYLSALLQKAVWWVFLCRANVEGRMEDSNAASGAKIRVRCGAIDTIANTKKFTDRNQTMWFFKYFPRWIRCCWSSAVFSSRSQSRVISLLCEKLSTLVMMKKGNVIIEILQQIQKSVTSVIFKSIVGDFISFSGSL